MVECCDSIHLHEVEELHVNLVGEILGLCHEALEVLAGTVLGSSNIASLVVVLLCDYSTIEHDRGGSAI